MTASIRGTAVTLSAVDGLLSDDSGNILAAEGYILLEGTLDS